MSGERETIDLAYIGRALQRLTTEVAGLRDEMRVQTAIILRREETLKGILDQLTAMVRQNTRSSIGCARSRSGLTRSKASSGPHNSVT